MLNLEDLIRPTPMIPMFKRMLNLVLPTKKNASSNTLEPLVSHTTSMIEIITDNKSAATTESEIVPENNITTEQSILSLQLVLNKNSTEYEIYS